jgi:hypothetical protein
MIHVNRLGVAPKSGGPEMAPQAFETMESAPENGACGSAHNESA